MTAIYAGSYAEMIFHGVIRQNKYPLYVCVHSHGNAGEARHCADSAKKIIKETNTLPEAWRQFEAKDGYK